MKVLSAACLLGLAGQTLAAATMQVGWTTDPSFEETNSFPSVFGPDGPWQAVVVELGNFTSPSTSEFDEGNVQGSPTPLYPCGSGRTLVLPTGFGGNYSLSGSNASTSALKLGISEESPDDWYASVMLNGSSTGIGVQDLVQIPDKIEDKNPLVNASFFVATGGWNNSEANNKTYPEQVGVLGLGRPVDSLGGPGGSKGSSGSNISSILDGLKSSGNVGSSSFGLHIGSVSQQIPGSLVLGGYDQSRTVGPVGVFNYVSGLPYVVLMDVTLGAARCDSPFPGSSIDQLYKGTAGTPRASQLVEQVGAPKGSALLVPNPATPYMSLPLGTCEAIAEHLPVTWNEDLALYTWNQEDHNFPKIVNSSAYLEVILNDATAKNISIKVPFKLLNLTLEPPLVSTPQPYFPCSPLNSSHGFWALGRSFLQAAFLGVNYDQNKTFLAQAPGPALNQSVIQSISSSDTTLTSPQSDALDSLILSWQDTWSSPACSDGAAEDSSDSSEGGIGGGAIAGIVVGVIIGLALIAAAVFFGWYRPRRNARSVQPSAGNSGEPMIVPSYEKSPAATDPNAGYLKSELPAQRGPAEVAGNDTRAEAGGSELQPRYELPTGA